MQTIQQPDPPIDPNLVSLQHIEKLLDKIDQKLGFFVIVTVLAIVVSFLT